MSTNGRVVLIGDTQVGKTSLIQRYLRKSCPNEQKSTIGAVFHTHEASLDNKSVTMQIWDTAGQERYRALGPIYYRKSNAAIAVFDLTDSETMNSLKKWIDVFRENSDDPFVIVAANKCDLDNDIKFDMNETMEWAHSVNAECIWTSAKTGIGIEDLFNAVLKHLVDANLEPHAIEATVDPANSLKKEEKQCC